MRASSIQKVLPLLVCTLLPLLAGADCPKGAQAGTRAHQGSWVASDRDSVTLMRFGPDGETLLAIESYTPNPLLDGMKIELHATCKPAADTTRPTDGSYRLECKEVTMVRSTQGLALLHDLVGVLGSYVSESSERPGELEDFSIRLEREGKELYYLGSLDRKRSEKTEREQPRRVKLEPVPEQRVTAFLERFREDTRELKPIESARRPRDLP